MFPIIQSTLLNSLNNANIQKHKILMNFENKLTKSPIQNISTEFKLTIERMISDNTNCDSEKNRFLINDGVFAEHFLPKDTKSNRIPILELLSHSKRENSNIRISSKGCLCATQNNNLWLRNIKLSQDVYSYNSIVEMSDPGNVQIRIVKDILQNHELILWFSEEILALMNISFLKPVNILGNNCYVCHICYVSFETPNPLKIHIATNCGQQQIDILWMRLYYGLQRVTTSTINMINNHSSSSPETNLDYNRHINRIGESQQLINPSVQLTSGSLSVPTKTAAQLEAVVSNIGSSKEGHFCIYCGKIYSRKYGLKIHIRTHTGFKPLKCKYCLRPFGDPSNLNKHVRLHIEAGGSTAKCNICRKVFGRKRDLQRHKETKHSILKRSNNNNGT